MIKGFKKSNFLFYWLKAIHVIAYFLFCNIRYFQKNRKKLSGITKKLLPELTTNFICPTIFDFTLCLGPRDGLWIYYLGFYELGTLHIMNRCLRKGDVFLDIGSSIGLMSMTAAKRVGQSGMVYAFEPHPERFNNLLNSIQSNCLENVKALNVGIGNFKASMYLDASYISPRMKMTSGNNRIRVAVDTIDAIMTAEKVDIVDFMKIDVEGFELQVLTGAVKLLQSIKPPIICIECNSEVNENRELDVEKIYSFLQSLDIYTFFQMKKSSQVISPFKQIHSFKELCLNDNLYCFTSTNITRLKNTIYSDFCK